MRAAKERTNKKLISAVDRDKQTKIKTIIGSIFLAVILWITMLYVANSIINEKEHISVYRAKVDIEEGTKITQDNLYDLVEVCNISEDLVPAGYITEPSKLIDTFTAREYAARDIITTSGISTEESMTRHIEDPIEISVGVTSIDAVVGGILRAGDYINIYSISSGANSTNAVPIVQNAYVTKALDSTGKELSRTNKESTATVINIIIPMEAEKQFNQELLNGTVRMSLVYNPDLENIQKSYDEKNSQPVATEEVESVDSTEIQWVEDTMEENKNSEEESTEEVESKTKANTNRNKSTEDSENTETGAE